MAVFLSPVGGAAAQFFTNTGAVLTGGKLYTYLAGTTTPATTYTNSGGGTAWTNPIVLDAAGRISGSGEVWLTDGVSYKFVLKDSTDVLIATYDNIDGINSIVIDASEVPYTPPFSGSVTTNVEAKLAQFVTPEDFGAVGDGTTDDTAAVQAAINYCMADPINPLTLLCAAKYYITASLMIDAPGVSVTTIRNNKFKILGVGGASGFYAPPGIVMFSATADHSTQSVGRFIQWENLAFVSTFTPLAATSVLDGAFIQVTFEQCVFTRVYCQRTDGVNTFSYWFFGCYIQDCPSYFFEMLYTSANDIIFDGCYFNGNDGNAFPSIHLSLVQGFKCTNNTFESLDGTPIVLRGSRACEISGNYFEACGLIGATYYVDLNEAGSGELAGVSISGNLFYMTSGQDADLAFYAINWDAVSAGSSNGNWCTGKLHRVVNAQPGYDLSINGDTESTTGSVVGRAPIRPTYRQFTSLSSSWYDYKPLASAPTAAEGRVYYNSTDHKLYCYDGTTWQALF
jgi:hypothetical protein